MFPMSYSKYVQQGHWRWLTAPNICHVSTVETWHNTRSIVQCGWALVTHQVLPRLRTRQRQNPWQALVSTNAKLWIVVSLFMQRLDSGWCGLKVGATWIDGCSSLFARASCSSKLVCMSVWLRGAACPHSLNSSISTPPKSMIWATVRIYSWHLRAQQTAKWAPHHYTTQITTSTSQSTTWRISPHCHDFLKSCFCTNILPAEAQSLHIWRYYHQRPTDVKHSLSHVGFTL